MRALALLCSFVAVAGAQEPLTVRFERAPVRAAVELLAREASLPVLVGPEVGGHVSLQLDAPAADALEALVRAAGLSLTRAGEVAIVHRDPLGEAAPLVGPAGPALELVARDCPAQAWFRLLRPQGELALGGDVSRSLTLELRGATPATAWQASALSLRASARSACLWIPGVPDPDPLRRARRSRDVEALAAAALVAPSPPQPEAPVALAETAADEAAAERLAAALAASPDATSARRLHTRLLAILDALLETAVDPERVDRLYRDAQERLELAVRRGYAADHGVRLQATCRGDGAARCVINGIVREVGQPVPGRDGAAVPGLRLTEIGHGWVRLQLDDSLWVLGLGR